MSLRPSHRGISVTIDVVLALVIISASVTIMFAFLADRDNEVDQDTNEARQLAETFDEKEIEISYTENDIYSGTQFAQQKSGTIASLLVWSAIYSVEAEGNRLITTNLPEIMEGKILSFLTESDTKAYIQVQWEPIPGHLEGVQTIGTPPPIEADVSSSTATYPAPINIDDGQLNAAIDEDRAAGHQIARKFVYGFFPPEDMQLAFETEGKNRHRTEYRYKHMARTLGNLAGENGETDIIDREIDHYISPNVNTLNDSLLTLLKDALDVSHEDVDDRHVETYRHVHITIETW